MFNFTYHKNEIRNEEFSNINLLNNKRMNDKRTNKSTIHSRNSYKHDKCKENDQYSDVGLINRDLNELDINSKREIECIITNLRVFYTNDYPSLLKDDDIWNQVKALSIASFIKEYEIDEFMNLDEEDKTKKICDLIEKTIEKYSFKFKISDPSK